MFTTDAGLVLCFQCWESAAPKCGHCKLPATGPVARFGGKIYHHECFNCGACSQPIRGKCALGPAGLFCLPCKESITAKMHEVKRCLSTGNTLGAAEIADTLLRLNGIKIPGIPELKCLRCTVKVDAGSCAQTANGFVCLRCKDSTASVEFKAQEPLSAGSLARDQLRAGSGPCSSCGYGRAEDGRLKCRACSGSSSASQSCFVCAAPFQPGQGVFQSASNKQVVCEMCYQAQFPPCGACAKPLITSVVRIGNKSYHSGCLYCSVCSEIIVGALNVLQCSESMTGLVCKQCQV